MSLQPSDGEQNGPNINGQAGASAYTSQTSASSTRDQYADLPPMQRDIVRFMHAQPDNPDGIHVGAIARAVGSSDANAIK
jgi:replication factor A2